MIVLEKLKVNIFGNSNNFYNFDEVPKFFILVSHKPMIFSLQVGCKVPNFRSANIVLRCRKELPHIKIIWSHV